MSDGYDIIDSATNKHVMPRVMDRRPCIAAVDEEEGVRLNLSEDQNRDRFGINPVAGTSFADIHTGSADLVHATANESWEILSDDANDTVGGSGAQKVKVLRLTEDGSGNWNRNTTKVSMSGTTPVAISGQGIRVLRLEVIDSNANIGNITVRVATAGADRGHILADKGQTLQTYDTVPSGYVGILKAWNASVGKNDDATVELQIREPGGAWRTQRHRKIFQNGFTEMLITEPLPAKTDIRMRAAAGMGTIHVHGGYEIKFKDLANIQDISSSSSSSSLSSSSSSSSSSSA